MRHIFIINPAAGKPETTAQLERQIAGLSFPHEGFYTRGEGDAQAAAERAARDGEPARLYACGGGTIPLLQAWLLDGMSMGSAAAFMVTGPSTKITNLGALKTVLGLKHFALYLMFVMAFSLATGLTVNLLV